MDEPTTALDVVVQRELLQRVLELRAGWGSRSVHHPRPAAAVELADRIAILYAGRIVEVGPPAMREHPAHPYTEGLFARCPLHGRGGPRRGSLSPPPESPPAAPGCRFAPRCPTAALGARRGAAPAPVGPGWSAACHHAEGPL